ncbi:sensor histidine kinase [Eggerthella sinensis]|uniref:sensor histidine kinase n=1 Tax=Eggerthella sinensis TaxID=242230 RepID=UPI00266D336F|nr:ATP-binding protein [Eggerthella sinensis]
MKINRQFTLVLLGSVLFFAVVSTMASYQTLSIMQEHAAYSFLTTTSGFAESMMQDQVTVFEAAGLAASPRAPGEEDDAARWDEYVASLVDALPDLGFALVVDGEGRQLSATDEVRANASAAFVRHIDAAKDAGVPSISSLDVIDLGAVFEEGSEAYERYLVSAADGTLVSRALMNLAVIAPADSDELLILGEVINNNPQYPAYYTDRVSDSFLSFVVDGVRVSTNLAPAEDHSSQLGTTVPVPLDDVADGGYFGNELSSAGYQYYYLYTPARNYWGEPIASMGVGIREAVYSNIIHNNVRSVFLVALVVSPLVIIVSWLFSNRITRPLKTGKRMAERIMRGDYAGVEREPMPEDTINESDQLVVSLRTMAAGLNESQQKIRETVRDLKASKEAAQDLSDQLLRANDNLEITVRARTLELQQLAEGLAVSNSTKTRFIANISHELKTPLTSSISASDLLLSEMFGTLNDKQRDYVMNIHRSSSHLLELINDILATAKIDEGRSSLYFETFAVGEALDEVVKTVAGSCPERADDIRVACEPANLELSADRVVLKQVLYNLLSNATKFSEAGSEMRIDVREVTLGERRVVDFSIADRGIGIAAADLERVFYEFEQVENSYSRTYEGTGLGLPLARRQVELHGGKLWLESELGYGTVARFFVPAQQDVPPDADEPDTTETPRSDA